MTSDKTQLQRLIALTRSLAEPDKDYVIVSEGNTSARIDEDTFWVKASGFRMQQIEASGFVEMVFKRVLAILDEDLPLSDAALANSLAHARADGSVGERPSVEVILHALALSLGQANFVGHTHPTVLNAILCSQQAEQAFQGRLFPDEIVVCGPAPAFVPYVDPGQPLAREVRVVLQRFLDAYGEPPKVILMQNHGLFALGKTPTEVENITAMSVKAGRILLGTYALGGPRYLTRENVDRIWTRPDELYRRKKMDAKETQ